MKLLSLALLLAALSTLDLAEAGKVGRWSTCYGSPPADSYHSPDGYIPAWSYYWKRFGRARDSNRCEAYFAQGWERVEKDGKFAVLR